MKAIQRFSQQDIQDVLAIVCSQPLPGSAIAAQLSAMGNDTFRGQEAQLYLLLHQMEQARLIRGRIRDLDRGTERRFYAPTALGKRRCSGTVAVSAPYLYIPIPEQEQSAIRSIRLRRWCSDATLGIRVSPDRELVAQELYDHLWDRIALLIAEGMDGDSAEQAVMAFMGSPLDLSDPMGQLHRPFWTLALRWAHRITIVLALFTLLCYGLHYLDSAFFRNTIVDFQEDAPPALSGTHQLLWRDSPGITQTAEGYRIHAYQTSLWHRTDLDGAEGLLLNIQLRITNPLPWSECPGIGPWIWGEDSLGNRYVCAGLDTPALEPAIQVRQYHTGTTTYILDLWMLQYQSGDAQWLDLHYDRDGRDITMRIPLSGGELP